MHITNNKEELLEFLFGTSEGAGISNKAYNDKLNEFHKELGKKGLSDFEEFRAYLNELIADYFLSEYEKIGVSPEEKVYGFKGDTKVELLEGGSTTKMFLESMNFKVK